MCRIDFHSSFHLHSIYFSSVQFPSFLFSVILQFLSLFLIFLPLRFPRIDPNPCTCFTFHSKLRILCIFISSDGKFVSSCAKIIILLITFLFHAKHCTKITRFISLFTHTLLRIVYLFILEKQSLANIID